MLRWIGSYESWIKDSIGVQWREHCINEWSKLKVPASEISDMWNEIATRSDMEVHR